MRAGNEGPALVGPGSAPLQAGARLLLGDHALTAAARLSSTRLLAGSLAATVFVLLVFALFPGLDMHAAALFALGDGRFAGQTAAGEVVRRVLWDIPFAVLALCAGLYLARRFGRARVWAPNGAGLAMMVLSLALGPGLLVNGVLKDHSHRPRPYQVDTFGGTDRFRPVLAFDGACRRNCSFVSGEDATAFWTLAPALLVPAPFEGVAIGAALVLGIATGALRMAFGGHFLSDCLLAGLFTWLVILGCWRLVARVAKREPAGMPPAR